MNKIIFWDWNGTLLNDLDACVGAMNSILSRRGMKSINTKTYQSLFNFPVIDYYKKLGFTFEKESFEDLSVEFIEEYKKRTRNAGLHIGVTEILKYFKANNYTQVVISAMEQNMLNKQLTDYGIAGYFSEIKGLQDIYAKSKKYLAEDYIKEHKVIASDILFIGDTLHDAEVAEQIGCNLALVSHGHHSSERLSVNGFKVFADLYQIKSFFN